MSEIFLIGAKSPAKQNMVTKGRRGRHLGLRLRLVSMAYQTGTLQRKSPIILTNQKQQVIGKVRSDQTSERVDLVVDVAMVSHR